MMIETLTELFDIGMVNESGSCFARRAFQPGYAANALGIHARNAAEQRGASLLVGAPGSGAKQTDRDNLPGGSPKRVRVLAPAQVGVAPGLRQIAGLKEIVRVRQRNATFDLCFFCANGRG